MLDQSFKFLNIIDARPSDVDNIMNALLEMTNIVPLLITNTKGSILILSWIQTVVSMS